MNVLLVLPDTPVTSRELARCRASLALELGECEVFLAARANCQELARVHCSNILEFGETVPLGDWHAVAFIDTTPGPSAAFQARWPGPVFRFSFSSRFGRAQLLAVDPRLNHDKEALAASIFHRLAPDVSDTTLYFPHGYIHRQLGMGPIDAFGHRITRFLEDLCNRDPNLKVVAVFGGSGAWSPECLIDESFCARLESGLGQTADRLGSPLQFVVLNFGGHGNVVIDQVAKFVKFCIDLKPDFVVSHDGYNDLVYGLINDRTLLGRYRMAYQENLEDWSPRLHKGWDPSARRTPQARFMIRNSIEAILRAYITRKRQFETVVSALGGHFVWGLQPFLESKLSLSQGEREYLSRWSTAPEHLQRIYYPALPRLYEALYKRTGLRQIPNLVDCHTSFRDLSPDVDHFVDHVHCTPEGDRVIAECYRRYFSQVLWGATPVKAVNEGNDCAGNKN